MKPEIETMERIVVCDGDESTLWHLCEQLRADRFEVLSAQSGAEALRLCQDHHPDLMLLDLDLPDVPGLDVLRTIRHSDRTEAGFEPGLPIIVLTDRGSPIERVRGLEGGADDYVQKPYAYEELRARIVAVLRRGYSRQDAPVAFGELVIDPARRKVTVGERDVRLSRKEFTLLRMLASDPTRVFGKDELLRDVWGRNIPGSKTRTLDSHASRLRRKLDPDGKKYVVNCWGIGYRLIRD